MASTGYDTTYGTSATTSDRDSVDLFGDADNEDEDEDVITGVTQPPKRIVLTKRTSILVTFVFVTILSIGTTLYTTIFYLDEYDYPPTQFSQGSLRDTLNALIALTIVTPVGFVILKFRITNLLIGVLFLFLLVLCLIFPAKGIAEAFYSLAEDNANNIHQYAKNPNFDHKLHNFWAAFQAKEKCCGTQEIDKVEDWPYFLNSTDLPASCCTAKQQNYAKSLGLGKDVKTTSIGARVGGSSRPYKPELDPTISYCGRGLARTRTRGVTTNKTLMFKRMYSGFFISLSKKDRIRMSQVLPLPFSYKPENFIVEILDVLQGEIVDVDAITAFKQIWKNFYIDSVCNTWDDLHPGAANPTTSSAGPVSPGKYCTVKSHDFDNDIAYPADLDHTTTVETIGIVKDLSRANETCMNEGWPSYAKEEKDKGKKSISKEEYCKNLLPKYRLNTTTIGRELLLQLDYLTSYIYEVAKPSKKDSPLKKKTWMLWPIPTRKDPNEIYPYKLNANYMRDPGRDSDDPINTKKMYYFSQGIAENLVLENIIFGTTCELLDADHLPTVRRKLARDLNRRWRRVKPFSEWKNQDEGLGYFFLARVRFMMYITLGVSSISIVCVFVLGVIFWQYYSRIKAEEYANLALPKDFEVLHLRRGSLIDEADIAKETVRPKKRTTKTLRGRARVGPTPGAFGRGLQRRPVRWGANVRQPQQPPHPFHHHPSQMPPGMGRGQGALGPGGVPPGGPHVPAGSPHHHSFY